MEEPQPLPQILSPCSSGRRSINSPEFEFWMVKNPSFPQPNLLSADELFSDGFILPLHHLPPPQDPETSIPEPEPENVQELPESNPANSTLTTNSKRWRHIFKKNGKKSLDSSVISSNSADDRCNNKEKDVGVNKEKKREKKNGGAFGVGVSSNVVSAAELNINIWPFSRSRSAGNGGARPRTTAATRKVSSAPCSRSNSTGESKSRKWPNSPSRAGVHLGRSSPVWQVRRGGGGLGRGSEAVMKNAEKGPKKDGNECRRKIPAAVASGGGAKARVLSLNVPMCIGYRPHLSCKTDENSAVNIAGGGSGSQIGVSGEGVRRGNLFNIKSLFTKKVY